MYKTTSDRYRAVYKTSIDTYRKQVKSCRAETIAKVSAFKKSDLECEAMESSSEEELETESETMTESETESEETVSEESEEEPEPTKPVKVSQTCDGSLQRMYNEQNANLFEIAKTSDAKYTDVSFPADQTSLFWAASNRGGGQPFKDGVKKLKEYYGNWHWFRVSDINHAPDNSIWGSKGILPAGIRQG